MILDRFSLRDQIGIVTGGGQGLDKAFCYAYAEAEAHIVMAELNPDTGRETAAEVEALGRRALFVETDVRERGSIGDMVVHVLDTFGRIDFLMNNAGIVHWEDARTVSEADWRNVIDVNLNGLFYCSQAVAGPMIERRSGRIVNIASMSGDIVNRPQAQASYNASKAAVIHLTRSLAAEWAPHNVRVNAIAPGYMRTATTQSFLENPNYGGAWIKGIPMDRFGEPDDLAPVAIFLASGASSYVTGTIITVDGGYTCCWHREISHSPGASAARQVFCRKKPMKRVLIAAFKQETATFNPVRTGYGDFEVRRGDDIVSDLRDTQTEIAGILSVLEARDDLRVVPTTAAWAVSGGPVAPEDLERLIGELIASIRDHPEVDGACIVFHGAMAGVDECDPEGRVLTAVREILGGIPIVVTLDLHAVITDRLMQGADILVPFHTYPHTDHHETGVRAAHNLLKLMDGAITPTTARVEIPMLVRGDELLTATGLLGEAIRACQVIEGSPGGLAAGVIIGNPFTDVPDLQSNAIVTTDSDPDWARREAERLAGFMWENRRSFVAELTPLDEAVRLAESTEGLTVFSDAADSTGSGAPSDSNAILKGLLEFGYAGVTLAPIVDAAAVAAAADAGVGADLTIPIGGTLDPERHSPLEIPVYVKGLFDGDFTYEDGTAGRAGRTAVFTSGNHTIMATERPVYIVDRKVFLAHGVDPEDFDLVVVKSPNSFRTHYDPIAARIVPVDVPGATSANLRALLFKHCVRPIFPLDEGVESPFPVGG